jgi:hypothetical protein
MEFVKKAEQLERDGQSHYRAVYKEEEIKEEEIQSWESEKTGRQVCFVLREALRAPASIGGRLITATGKTLHPLRPAGYLTPPATPPLIVIMTIIMYGIISSPVSMHRTISSPVLEPSPMGTPGTRQEILISTNNWHAAFMAGTLADSIGLYQDKPLDKARLQRAIALGQQPHRREFPPLPTQRTGLENHILTKLFKEAEKDYLKSYMLMNLWLEIKA